MGLQLLGVAWEASDGVTMATAALADHSELRVATPTRVFFTYTFYRYVYCTYFHMDVHAELHT